MRTRALATVVVFAALGVAWPAVSRAALKTETATAGSVKATLTYKVAAGFFRVSGTHLTIARAGVTVLDTDVPAPCNQCGVVPAGASGGKSLQIADLDGDGEPEVLLDIYTGGAHCCTYSWIYRFTGTSYSGTSAAWGDVGYTLADLDRDGIPELRSFDDRFAYAFTDFADSWFPPMIWQFRAGKLIDVTRSYPALIKADAKKTRRTYRGRARRDRDLRGVVAAYVADQYLLGHGSKGWRLVSSARKHGLLKGFGEDDSWPHGKRFAKALRKFLHRKGYTG